MLSIVFKLNTLRYNLKELNSNKSINNQIYKIMARKKKQTYVPKWKQLLKEGWKVYNDGINNKMFPDTKAAKEAGYSMEGFAPRYNAYTTHFTYNERYGRLK